MYICHRCDSFNRLPGCIFVTGVVHLTGYLVEEDQFGDQDDLLSGPDESSEEEEEGSQEEEDSDEDEEESDDGTYSEIRAWV